jgi:hypothetical protein
MRTNSPFRRRTPIGAWLAASAAALVLLPGARGVATPEAVASNESGFQSPAADTAPLAPAITETANDEAAEPVAAVPHYQWATGASYPYTLTIQVDHGREIETLSGTPTLNVRGLNAGHAEFSMTGGQLASTRVTKPGREPEFDPLSFPRVPRFPRMAFPTGGWRGPSFSPGLTLPAEHLVRIDERGRIVSEQGEGEPLPYLLGQVSELLIAPLPEHAVREWQETTGTEIAITREEDASDPFAIPTSLLVDEPRPESLAAETTASYSISSDDDGRLTLHRSSTLNTIQQLDGQPRITLSQDATWQFDQPGEPPERLAAEVSLVVRDGNVTTTYPIHIEAARVRE